MSLFQGLFVVCVCVCVCVAVPSKDIIFLSLLGLKHREERVVGGEVKPTATPFMADVEEEEEPEILYDKVNGASQIAMGHPKMQWDIPNCQELSYISAIVLEGRQFVAILGTCPVPVLYIMYVCVYVFKGAIARTPVMRSA